jgi:cytochrome P450
MSIHQYKSNVKPGSRKDSLGQLISARDEDGIGLTHEEVLSAAFIFMVAGLTKPTRAG